MALPSEKVESILYGMVCGFDFFGCVPREVWWDNSTMMATEILIDRQRRMHPRYQALACHYNFEPLFCQPRRGNEKPDVENRVKRLQRTWATPVPIRASKRVVGGGTKTAIFNDSYLLLRSLQRGVWTGHNSALDSIRFTDMNTAYFAVLVRGLFVGLLDPPYSAFFTSNSVIIERVTSDTNHGVKPTVCCVELLFLWTTNRLSERFNQ